MKTTLILIVIALIIWYFILCMSRQPKYFIAKIGEFWYICYEDLTQIDEVYRVAKLNTFKDAVEYMKKYEL